MKNYISLLVILCYWISALSPALADTVPEDMVLIKKGCFVMGTNKKFYYNIDRENFGERPAHKVCVDSFYLDMYEVSQKKWEQLMEFNNTGFFDPDFPVSRMEWHEARRYCAIRGHRLPTEAEWEYAARAGSQADNPWGDGINGDYLWYARNSVRRMHKVGAKKPNAFGLYDMMGNVWEWVEDWYDESYYGKSPVNNPKGSPTRKSWRVIRGGSWVDGKDDIRVTIRFPGMSDPTENFWLGLRCAYSAKK